MRFVFWFGLRFYGSPLKYLRTSIQEDVGTFQQTFDKIHTVVCVIWLNPLEFGIVIHKPNSTWKFWHKNRSCPFFRGKFPLLSRRPTNSWKPFEVGSHINWSHVNADHQYVEKDEQNTISNPSRSWANSSCFLPFTELQNFTDVFAMFFRTGLWDGGSILCSAAAVPCGRFASSACRGDVKER